MARFATAQWAALFCFCQSEDWSLLMPRSESFCVVVGCDRATLIFGRADCSRAVLGSLAQRHHAPKGFLADIFPLSGAAGISGCSYRAGAATGETSPHAPHLR